MVLVEMPVEWLVAMGSDGGFIATSPASDAVVKKGHGVISQPVNGNRVAIPAVSVSFWKFCHMTLKRHRKISLYWRTL